MLSGATRAHHRPGHLPTRVPHGAGFCGVSNGVRQIGPHNVYRANPEGESRYSPAKCIGTTSAIISGDPNPKHISTSSVERQNLTMVSIRRFTRLTNAFSKKLENHAAMVAIY